MCYYREHKNKKFHLDTPPTYMNWPDIHLYKTVIRKIYSIVQKCFSNAANSSGSWMKQEKKKKTRRKVPWILLIQWGEEKRRRNFQFQLFEIKNIFLWKMMDISKAFAMNNLKRKQFFKSQWNEKKKLHNISVWMYGHDVIYSKRIETCMIFQGFVFFFLRFPNIIFVVIVH